MKKFTFELLATSKKPLILVILVIGIVLSEACTAPSAISPNEAPIITQNSTTTQTTKAYIYTDGRIEVRGSGEPIELINNPNAHNPTFAELVAFLERDRTDEYSYIFGPPKIAFVCSDFAETVHNNAEAAGMRAAWVGIDIEGETERHALNAFQTTDLGLVYIDCTGRGVWDESTNRINWDRRAHVEIGKPYGLAGMNMPTSHFWFYICSGESYLGNTEEEIYEWHRTHDIKVLGQKWTQEWLLKYAVELSKCGRVLEPKLGDSQQVLWHDVTYSTSQEWIVGMFDSWEVTWFQPEQSLVTKVLFDCLNWRGFRDNVDLPPDAKVEQKIIIVDGLSIGWEIGWMDYTSIWLQPFGNKVVKDIHIYWGE